MTTIANNSPTTMGVATLRRVERQLGDTETSYFLPSREDGVNDMYLHIGCDAHSRFFDRTRVTLIWAMIRIRHPLLAATVEMRSYEDIRFVYDVPPSPEEAIVKAAADVQYRKGTKDELIDSYLNGPRALSNSRLSTLMVSSLSACDERDVRTFDLLLCATHYIGDGISLQNTANQLFSLLASPKTNEELKEDLIREWEARCQDKTPLPPALEDQLPKVPVGRFRAAAHRIDFEKSQYKLIGGHSFLKATGRPRHTVVPTISFDEERTKRILRRCKENDVSISAALFALCNFAWARVQDQKWELPTMMYSALNLRPYLHKDEPFNDTIWFIAIGYFNIVLSSFLPKSPGSILRLFWHRARQAKHQSTLAAKSPLLTARSRAMASQRAQQSKVWAKEDDERAAGIWTAPPTPKKEEELDFLPPRPPSQALIGLSLLGNLDSIYIHSTFPDIKLHTLTTGSRQRSGGMLLFGYTFVGKLWISLGYDEHGFAKDVVADFWRCILEGVDEFLG